MSSVGTRQRYRRGNPCPICDGWDEVERGNGERCFGFLSSDGEYAHCTREELAGALPQESYGTYAHKLSGECKCGVTHGPAQPKSQSNGMWFGEYDYRSADGTLLYQVLRKVPKKFLQRRPDGKGDWIWNLGDTERVPYRLPELLAATSNGHKKVVWIGEGEQVADALVSLGFVATTNSEGAGKFRPTIARWFEGLDVVVVADNDEPGLKHADQVAAILAPTAASVKVLNDLPVKEKGDVVDLIQAMGEEGAKDFLLSLAEDTEPIKKAIPKATVVSETLPQGVPVKFGSGWRFGIDGYTLHFANIRDKSDGIHAEVSMYNGMPRRVLRDLRLNIGSPRTIGTFAKDVESLIPGHEWKQSIREACDDIIDAWRVGEPPGLLSDPIERLDTPYAIYPLLAENETNIIHADKGSNKSYLALALQIAYMLGLQLPGGLEVRSTGQALYLDWETNKKTHQRRAKRLCMGWGVEPPAIVYQRVRRKITDAAAVIEDLAYEHNASFTVIDSAAFAAGGDIIAPDVAITVMNAIANIPGTKLVIGQISSATANGDNGNALKSVPFGSRMFYYAARMVWAMQRTEDGRIGLFCQAANDDDTTSEGLPPVGLAFDFTPDFGPVRLLGAPIDGVPEFVPMTDKKRTPADKIYDHIYDNGAGTIRQISLATNLAEGTVRKAVTQDSRFKPVGDASSGGTANKWAI